MENIKNLKTNKKHNVFVVTENNKEINTMEIKDRSVQNNFSLQYKDYGDETNTGVVQVEDNGLVRCTELTFDYLINEYKNPENHNLIEELFSSKDENLNIGNKCLFVFENIPWHIVVLKFKLTNVELSGGSITNRHILSTTKSMLTSYLILFFGIDEVQDISYNGSKKDKLLLSPRINKKYYNSYTKDILKIYTLKPGEVKEKILAINKLEGLGHNESEIGEIIVIVNNYIATRKVLIQALRVDAEEQLITTNNKKLDSLKMKYNNLESRISTANVHSRKGAKQRDKEIKQMMLTEE